MIDKVRLCVSFCLWQSERLYKWWWARSVLVPKCSDNCTIREWKKCDWLCGSPNIWSHPLILIIGLEGTCIVKMETARSWNFVILALVSWKCGNGLSLQQQVCNSCVAVGPQACILLEPGQLYWSCVRRIWSLKKQQYVLQFKKLYKVHHIWLQVYDVGTADFHYRKTVSEEGEKDMLCAKRSIITDLNF